MLDFKFGLQWQYGEKKGSFTLIHRPFIEGINDYAPAFQIIAEEVLETHVLKQFESEGSSEGTTWQELAPATVARRGSAHPILHVTGALERSFQKGGEDHVEKIGPKTLRWGSVSPLAMFHEFGTGGKVNFKSAKPRGNKKTGGASVIYKTRDALDRYEGRSGAGIPPRPMLVYSAAMSNGITSVMRGRILQVARRVGYAASSRGGDRLSPLEARQIGMALLRDA